MNVGDRVITPDGPGLVTWKRKDLDNPRFAQVVRGKLWLFVKLDGDPDGKDHIYNGDQVRPE